MSWPLTSIDHFQFVPGSATHVTSDGAEFMLGADPAAAAGEEFERAVKLACLYQGGPALRVEDVRQGQLS